MDTLPFNHVAVGGTFDRLHIGHKALLQKAFAVSQEVSIGVTTQAMQRKKRLAHIIEDYNTRCNALENYLSAEGWLGRAKLLPLHDKFGPTITDQSIEALVVSSQTVVGAKEVNSSRKLLGLSVLPIVVADYIAASDKGHLSSTRIRFGEINRNGLSYVQFMQSNAPFIPTVAVRTILQEPLGAIVTGAEGNLQKAVADVKPVVTKATCIYIVGDIVSYSFIEAGLGYDLAVFDYKNKRKRSLFLPSASKENFYKAINPPGHISNAAIDVLTTIQVAIILAHDTSNDLSATQKKPKEANLLIDGEEDLLVLPLILLAPLNAVILYGQSGQGIVVVDVTESKKEEILLLLQQSVYK